MNLSRPLTQFGLGEQVPAVDFSFSCASIEYEHSKILFYRWSYIEGRPPPAGIPNDTKFNVLTGIGQSPSSNC